MVELMVGSGACSSEAKRDVGGFRSESISYPHEIWKSNTIHIGRNDPQAAASGSVVVVR